MRHMKFVRTMGVVCAMVITSAAQAQVGQVPDDRVRDARDDGRGFQVIADSVATRPRPGYEALGYRIAGMRAVPSASILAGYDTNLYNREVPKIDDALVSIRPKLTLRSEWSRHRLDVDADAAIQHYASRTIENNTQLGLNVSGQLDIRRDWVIRTQVIAARRIETRGSSGDLFIGQEPVQYGELTGTADMARTFGKLDTTVGVRASRFNYEDVRIDGVAVPLAFRNYRVVSGNARVAYAFAPALQGFVRASLNKANYPNRGGIDSRASSGYSVVGGVGFAVSRLLSGEVGLGYLQQDYKSAQFPDIGGLAYVGRLYWNPTTLVSVTATARRDIQRAPQVGVAGITEDLTRVHVDYELLRNLIIGSEVDYTRSDFNGIDRIDHRFAGTVQARYLANRWLSLTASANARRQRASGSLGRAYDGAGFLLGLTVQR